MTSKVIEGHKWSSNFNPTLPLMDSPLMLPSQIVCISISLTLHLVLYSPLFFLSYSLFISLSTSLFCSMQTLIYILKGHMRPLLCCVIFNDFQIFWSNYNLDLLIYISQKNPSFHLYYFFYIIINLNIRPYGQFFVLVYIKICINFPPFLW